MLVIVQQQSLLSQLLEQCFDLNVLELDDLLLTLVYQTAESSQQKLPQQKQDGHVRR